MPKKQKQKTHMKIC